jgi:ATP-dependent phosphofructokinase / diphosphate-dependent phosphofructokinase
LSDGSFSDGSLSDGALSDGSLSDGSLSDGPSPDGSLSDGSFSDGSSPDGSLSDGPSPNGSFVPRVNVRGMSRPRIGVLTGGGDAPGLNAVIRAVVRAGTNAGFECIGIEDSFDGLIFPNRTRPLLPSDVVGIHRLGGTILGTTNRGNPFEYPDRNTTRDVSAEVIANFRAGGYIALIAIGGDGTLAIAHEFHRRGIPIIGVPKTIDNDIVETSMTFGFDTAVAFATEAIDRLHTTADAHHRIMVVEVMGRYAGWIALYSALAGGADVALIPEIPFDLERVATRLREREALGARSGIIVAAEGAAPAGGARVVREKAAAGRQERLGGIAEYVALEIQRLTGKESRFVVLGHLQRGGGPLAYDRVLATRFGSFAIDLVRKGQFGVMAALRSPDIVAVPLESVVGRQRTVPPDSDVVQVARNLGMSLGD